MLFELYIHKNQSCLFQSMITIFNTYIGATELLFALVESTTHTRLFCHSCKFVPVKHTLSSTFYDF